MPARECLAGSPTPGSSILMISAPKSPSIIVATAPGSNRVRSNIVIPSSGRIIVSVMLERLLFAGNRFLLLVFARYTEALERAVFVGDPAIAAETARACLLPPRIEKDIDDDSLRDGNAVTARRVIENLTNGDQRLFRVIEFEDLLALMPQHSRDLGVQPVSPTMPQNTAFEIC